MARTSSSKVFRNDQGHLKEIAGIVLLAGGLFAAAALLSLQFGNGHLMGPVGHLVARGLYALAGIGAHFVAAALVLLPLRLLSGRRLARLVEGVGFASGLVALVVLLHLVGGGYRVDGIGAGGVLGEYLAEVLRAGVGTAGTALIGAAGLAIAAAVITGFRMAGVLGLLTRGGHAVGRGIRFVVVESARFVGDVVRAILPERDEPAEDDSEDAAPVEELAHDTVKVGPPEMEPIIVTPRGRKKKIPSPPPANDDATVIDPPAPKVEKSAPRLVSVPPEAVPVPVPTPTPAPPARVAAETVGPVILESEFHKAADTEMAVREKAAVEARPDYRLPPVSILRYDGAGAPIDRDAMLEVSARLVRALADFGVKGEVQAIRPGPVVTMYEFVPVAGTRVNKITNLSDDLAMRLEALRVRIVAPIPGKNAVGIEVPNKVRETVFLKEILADDVFQKAKSKLTIALGKDIEGRPVTVDLSRMPHLLVAGTTGAGKSVSVNAMIMSILFSATPEEVRMIMVDPKMLELSIYEGIPHLLLPVVTDPKKANLALRWAVEEMERRYELLAEAGVRDIISYNKKIDGTGELKKLPYILVIVDEFADLMMTAPKDVETSVARIAQKARAAGIHLLLATQRPSVDVITGLIKANFPSRVAFQVASKIDSRTILDQQGAEALLGQGDMLFSDRGSALRRVHGCLVQDEEIKETVDLLKLQGKPVYDLDILKPRDDEENGEGAPEEDMSDDMYDKAVALVAETRQASISMIQRRLRIGYNRAARMVERMEREGIVGPADGPNRREVLIQAAG